jgi:hypothetical protein
MQQMVDRMIRAARLEPALYEEVEADRSTMGQAAAVVLISSLAAGIPAFHVAGVRGIATVTLFTVLGWYIWAALTWFIGTRILPEPETRADIGELLRTLGFSSAPGVIRVFGIIPGIGVVIEIVASFWMLASMVVAVRQALDYTSTPRAVAVCLIGFIVQLCLTALVLWPMHAQ